MALDANDNLFVGDAAGERVIEFHATPASPATNYTTIAPTELASGAMRSFTVNPATDEVWVLGDDGTGTHVKGFELNGYSIHRIRQNCVHRSVLQLLRDAENGRQR